MKHAIGLLTVLLILNYNMVADEILFRAPGENDIILESSLIKLVDGLSIGIDGRKIAMMIKVRQEVKKIQYGMPNESGELIGAYQFGTKRCSVYELSLLEDEYRMKDDKQALTQLAELLKLAKRDFIEKVKPYMATARGAKRQMLLLIEESCKKRKRFDSILLRWGAAREEEEERQFEKDIVDFKIFNTFCTDLMHFMEDVIRSCPKAMAQFMQMLENQGHKQH